MCDQLAIEAVARMLGVAEDSSVARVFAKRLLRQPRSALRERPNRGASALIVTLGVIVGCVVGWIVAMQLF